jgi:hypothetical protein
MLPGKLIFSEIISYLPKYEFTKFIAKYKGNYKVHEFSCWNQYS